MARLLPHELLAPHGPLSPTLFPKTPENVLAISVEHWLNTAYAQSAVADETNETLKNRMAKAYALYLAFTSVADRMAGEPLDVSVTEKGSHGYDMKQIEYMQQRAASYLDEFNGLVPVPTFDALPGSGTIRTYIYP